MSASRLAWLNRRRAPVMAALVAALLLATGWPRPLAAPPQEIKEDTPEL